VEAEIEEVTFKELLEDREPGKTAIALQVSGLPESLTTLSRFVKDADRTMAEEVPVTLRCGKAEFILPPASYTSLLSVNALASQPNANASGH
jgi:hypothetical protein